MANFMIEFKVLAMKADTYELYAIFLLKKNVQMDIIKTILEYPLIVISETLKEQKIVITLVGQEYKEDMITRQKQKPYMEDKDYS